MEKNKRESILKISMKKRILLEFFYVSGLAVLIFIILETVFPGVVLAYFNLGYLLILWLITGIVLVLTK